MILGGGLLRRWLRLLFEGFSVCRGPATLAQGRRFDGRRIQWHLPAPAAEDLGSGIGGVPGSSPADVPQRKGFRPSAADHCFGHKRVVAKMHFQIQVCSSSLPGWRSGGGGWKTAMVEALAAQLTESQGSGCYFYFLGILSAVVPGQLSLLYFGRMFLRLYVPCTVCLL